MPGRIFLLTKKAKAFLVLSLLLIIAAILIVQPRLSKSVKASPSNDNTSVFTGQFLPAFLGGAYDPTEAYKRIAGLPVYVFGYDRWSGTQAMVINNYAIRTQIRADGSFQVQGLPTAAHYAVYFPYKLKADGGVERTDCVAGAGALDPCANDTAKTAEFRWPDDEDQIKDVFSYAQGDASAVTIGNTQVDNQQVKLGKVFLTNETRVDIVNHINVFPLVPNKTLKIVLKDYTDDSSFEVVAQRIVSEKTEFESAANSLTVPVSFPIIRGRTSSALAPGSGYKIYNKTFQAYAPPGKYVISYWRTESNNPSYKDWDTKSPVNSIKNGLSLEKVTRDWRAVSSDPNLIGPVWPNGIKIWGTVTDKDGYLMDGTNENHPNVLIDLKSDTGLENTYAGRNDETGPDKNFYAPGLGLDLPTRTIWGIYAIAQTVPESIALTFSTQIEMPWVYIKEEVGKNYQQDPQPPKPNTSSKFIRGTDGPIRIDLTASKGTNSSGYNTGLFLKLGCPTAGCPDFANANARLVTDNSQNFSIPALSKTYGANRLGEIYIPDADLKRDQAYGIEIRAGNMISYPSVNYPSTGYLEQTVQLAQSSYWGTSESYKFLGIVPIPFFKTAIASSDGKVHGKVTLKMAGTGTTISGLKITFKAIRVVNSIDKVKDGYPCTVSDGCGVLYNGVVSNDLPAGLEGGGEFEIVVPQPLTVDQAKVECAKAFISGGLISAAYCGQLLSSDRITETYSVNVAGTTVEAGGKQTPAEDGHTFQVDSKNPTIMPFVLTPGFSCNRAFPVDGLNWNILSNVPCNMGMFFSNSLDGFFNFIQKNGLQMRPLTLETGVVNVWNVNRALANIFFVILLIIIGIATILRLEPKTYNLGTLLPRLFINIALANFSLLLVQILIDTANILTQTFFTLMEGVLKGVSWTGGGQLLSSGSPGVAGSALMGGLAGGLALVFIGAIVAVAVTSGAALIPILTFILSLVLSVVVFALGLILLFFLRYAGVWIATALAPIFFVVNTLPSKTFEGLSKLFWSTVLPLIFMGPVMAFVLGMGMLLLTIGGDENGLFAGFGTAIVGLLALFATLQVPGILSGLFGKGLINAEFGGKEGTSGMAGGMVAGRLGAKDMDTLKKERLNASAMEGFAERGKGDSRFGALGGVFKGLTGRYATQDAEHKQFEANVKAGGASRAKPWQKARTEMTGDAELARQADVSPDQFKLLSGYFNNASRTKVDEGLYTGNMVPKRNAAGIPLITGEQEAERITLGDFFTRNGIALNAKGEVGDKVAAINAFKKIKPPAGATDDQIEAQNLNMQKMRQFARVTKVPD